MTRQISIQEESAYILATLSRIKEEMHEIKHQGNILNQIYSATRSLPSEILAKIFLDACNDTDSFRDIGIRHPVVQVINCVCSQWRGVASNTPSLWAHAKLIFLDCGWVTDTAFQLFQLHYCNAGGFPLNVLLDVSTCSGCDRRLHHGQHFFASRKIPTKYTSYTDVFNFIFIQHPEKLGSLNLTPRADIPHTWLEIIEKLTFNVPSEFPNLTSITVHTISPAWDSEMLSWYKKHEYNLFKASAVPNLRNIHIPYLHPVIRVPLTGLTSLRLCQFPIDDCLTMLVDCPNLIDFHAEVPAAPTNRTSTPAPVATQRTALAMLQKLSWGFGFKGWDAILMNHFEFPSLTFLRVEHSLGSKAHRYRDSLKDVPNSDFLVQYWLPFLSSLRSPRRLWEVLDGVSTLESIEFREDCHPGRNADDILKPLTLQNGVGLLSQLRSLCFAGFQPLVTRSLGHPADQDYVDLFLCMLESRVLSDAPLFEPRLRTLQFHVYNSRSGTPNPSWDTIVEKAKWTERQKERATALLAAGLDIQVEALRY
ncbi:hypothetical protein NP233_g3608 [Leucocoprinus birnbaumii]|uniref:F-box domain-containing protein n=1 Tax=Leucocoprinus birnbaumii TaxID=56174 RepID=A0AAD5VXN5_9AGAR|nr:hypothetical protein NP233_g3608 [Leucocoprinus birnbaumii]